MVRINECVLRISHLLIHAFSCDKFFPIAEETIFIFVLFDSSIFNVISSSLTSTTVPIIPPIVRILSFFCRPCTICLCWACFLRGPLKRNKYITTIININGNNCIKGDLCIDGAVPGVFGSVATVVLVCSVLTGWEVIPEGWSFPPA